MRVLCITYFFNRKRRGDDYVWRDHCKTCIEWTISQRRHSSRDNTRRRSYAVISVRAVGADV